MPFYSWLAERLPDLPRWVEARAVLINEGGDLFSFQEEPELSFVLRDPSSEFVAVIGAPDVSAVQTAVKANVHGGSVLALPDLSDQLAAALPGWTRSRLIFHLLGPTPCLPETLPGQVRFLDPGALDQLPVPMDLLNELKRGAEHSPISATFVEGQPVSFCYACAITETLWDIAIDTLPAHRRRGYAALCVAHMIRHMRTLGRQPVWQAAEQNPGSWRLAQKLGFIPVDEMVLFEPSDEVYT